MRDEPKGGEKMPEDNTIFVGNKETMNYVQAVMTQFNSGSDEVDIKARGRAISKAVDVAEITRHRFIEEADLDDIEVDTEELENDGGDTVNVSSIELKLRK